MRLQGLVRLAVEGQGRVPGLGLRVSSFQGLEAKVDSKLEHGRRMQGFSRFYTEGMRMMMFQPSGI